MSALFTSEEARGSSKGAIYSADTGKKQQDLVGHENTVWRAVFSPDSRQLATVSADATVRLWDLETENELFTLPLPTQGGNDPVPLWDFDFRCADLPEGEVGRCWIAVPLTSGRLVLYDLVEAYR